MTFLINATEIVKKSLSRAHPMNPSYLDWVVTGETVKVEIPIQNINRLSYKIYV
jgi:hypothetical protein